MEIDRSSLIVSKAGRDKGQLFYVIDADEQYVYLADGKSRKLEKPKRKKRKHVQAAFQTADEGAVPGAGGPAHERGERHDL